MLKLSAVFMSTSAFAGLLISDNAQWGSKVHLDTPMIAAAYVGECPVYRSSNHVKVIRAACPAAAAGVRRNDRI